MAISRNPDKENNHYSQQTGHLERGIFPRAMREYQRFFGVDSTRFRGFRYDPVDLDRSMIARQSSPQVQKDMVARVLKYRQNKPRG